MVGQSFPVHLGWFAAFTFAFTPLAVACIAGAVVACAAVQVYAVDRVLRRRMQPLRLLFCLTTSALLVATSDVYLIGVQNTARVAVPFPAPGLSNHLLTQDALIAVAVVTAALVWRHPDLVRRTSVGLSGDRTTSTATLDDLAFAHREPSDRWVDQVLPNWAAAPSIRRGRIAIRPESGDDDLVCAIETFCRHLGFPRVDEARTRAGSPDRPGRTADRSAPRRRRGRHPRGLRLVDSLEVSEDAAELRRTQWVDIRRQDVRAFRDLARALLADAPPSRLVPSPVAPSRFVAPGPIATVLTALVGQTTVALQLGVLHLAVPASSPAWRVPGAGALLTGVAVNARWRSPWCAAMATPRTFRQSVAAATLAAVVADVAVLRTAGGSPVAVVAVASLAVAQVLVSAGCVAASFTTWMARGPSGGPPSLTAAALWPRAAAGLLPC